MPGVDLVMEAFEGYWRKVPSVKRLVFKSMPDETTRAAALKAGDVDIVYLLSGPTAQEVKRTPGLRLAAAVPPGVVSSTCPISGIRSRRGHDRRVRLAASYALDRNALNQAETLGLSRPTGGLIPRGLEFARAYEPPAYDPAQPRSSSPRRAFRTASMPATSRRSRRSSPRRGDRRTICRPWHPDADAHDGARGVPDRVAREEDQGRDHGPRRAGRQRGDPHRGRT